MEESAIDHEPVSADRTVEDPTSFYRREYAAALRLAVTLVDIRAIAEDVVQDSFARVWARWDSLENPGGYLRVCIVNAGRKELRRRRLARRTVDQPVPDVQPEDGELLASIRRLPPRRRAVVVLRFYEDMTEAQIADALNMRVGTVKATLHQALAQLREVIDHD
jgi:RNA polymerase sigma-70 factor (sigma-E family)